MSPTPSGSGAASAAPLPPLPDMQSAGQAGAGPAPGGFLAALMSAVTPVKAGVDAINAACQQIVQSGSIPGAEQICGQIVGLAGQLIPMAMQQASQGGMGGMGSGMSGGGAPPPGGAGMGGPPPPMPGM